MLHRSFLKRTAVLQVAENILTLCNEPRNLVRMRSPKKKTSQPGDGNSSCQSAVP